MSEHGKEPGKETGKEIGKEIGTEPGKELEKEPGNAPVKREKQYKQSEKRGQGGPGGGPWGGRMGMPVEKPKDAKRTLLRLWKYLRGHSLKLAVILLTVVASSLLGVIVPRIPGLAIDRYIIPGDFGGLGKLCLMLAAINIGSAGLTYVQSLLLIRVTMYAVTEMRRELFSKMQALPLRFFDTRTHGELMSRVTNDVENVSNALSQTITQVVSNVITLAGTLIMMLSLSPILTLVAMVTIPLTLVLIRFVTKRSRTYFSAQQKILGRLNGQIEETISGQKVVKIFTHENAVIKEFEATNQEFKGAALKAQIVSGMLGPFTNALNNIGYALVVAAGGLLVIRGQATIGDISSFTVYARQFSWPINAFANMINMIQSAIAGAERVFEVIDEQPEPADVPDARALSDIEGRVELRGVDFSYAEGKPVLKRVDILAQPGQTIALVGPTGAGKTTIINLLTRFYDIDAGEIEIDGQNIRMLRRSSLRSLLGIVLQDTYLFTGTIRENIRYGRVDATDAEIIAASKLANAHEFVRRLPSGYDTELTEGGSSLSQGQRQMLSIARAILADPAILVLDEATSSVDTRTEMKIQEAMRNLMRGRTSFVIAHRLSTIKNADMIAVIDHGEIVERGTHDQLLAQEGFYSKLYNSQFAGQQPEAEPALA